MGGRLGATPPRGQDDRAARGLDLLDGREAVAEAAVIGVEDQKFGQRLKAFVVTKADTHLTADEVKDYVKANLAGYKAPRDVEFVAELPRNATGKVLKRELQQTATPKDHTPVSS